MITDPAELEVRRGGAAQADALLGLRVTAGALAPFVVTTAVRCAKILASLPFEANAKCRRVTGALRSWSETHPYSVSCCSDPEVSESE